MSRGLVNALASHLDGASLTLLCHFRWLAWLRSSLRNLLRGLVSVEASSSWALDKSGKAALSRLSQYLQSRWVSDGV